MFKFIEEYEPTKADAYRRTIQLQGDEVQIDILDTAGQEDYAAVRDGYLKHGDGFLLVFDLTNRETFESIKNHRFFITFFLFLLLADMTYLIIIIISKRENVLRVKADDSNLPIIMIGNKKDLDKSRRILYDEANTLATNWNIPYIETSAKTRENVDRAFSEIFVKIKELKAQRQRNSTMAANSNSKNTRGASASPAYYDSNLTKEEEDAIREHSLKKRIKKYYQNVKKKCILS